MNTANKVLLTAFLVLIAVVVIFKYQQFFVNEDYILFVNAECRPGVESCFQADCSVEDDPSCDLTPYKKLELPARNAPECLLNRTCLDVTCNEVDEECSVMYCTDSYVEEGERCFEEDL